MTQGDHAHIRVRVVAIGVRVAAVRFAIGDQLGMYLEPHHQFVSFAPMAHGRLRLITRWTDRSPAWSMAIR